MSDRADRLRATLFALLGPAEITIQDDSERHRHHAGARAGGQTHYSVRVVSARFEGLDRVSRHRLVNEALAAEFADGLHALALRLLAPGEGG